MSLWWCQQVLYALLSGPMGPPEHGRCTQPTLVVVVRLHQPLISGIATKGFQLGQSATISPFHHFHQFHVKSMKVMKW